jgi:hypothetical protein
MKSDADLVEASKSWTQRQRERRRREGKCRFCETPSGAYATCADHRVRLAAQALARKRSALGDVRPR